jgi:hypothetical protein
MAPQQQEWGDQVPVENESAWGDIRGPSPMKIVLSRTFESMTAILVYTGRIIIYISRQTAGDVEDVISYWQHVDYNLVWQTVTKWK